MYESEIHAYFRYAGQYEEVELKKRLQGKIPAEILYELQKNMKILLAVKHKSPEISKLITRVIFDKLLPKSMWLDNWESWSRHLFLHDCEEVFSTTLRSINKASQSTREEFPQSEDGVRLLENFFYKLGDERAEQERRSFFSQTSQQTQDRPNNAYKS